MLVPVLQSCHSCINGFTFWFLIKSLGVPQRDLPGVLVEMHSQQRAGAQDGGLAIRLYHSLVVQRTSKVESAIKPKKSWESDGVGCEARTCTEFVLVAASA